MRAPRLAASLLALATLAALSGCGTHAPPPLSEHDINVARRFTVYNVYWVGRWFQGVPLTAADFRREYNPQVGLGVYYGNCETKGSLLGAGTCTLPLEIRSVCYVQHHNAGLGPHHSVHIRGVPGVIFDGGKSIELYSAHVAIDIYADTPARALAAARRVYPLNGPEARRHFEPLLPPPLFVPDTVHKLPKERRTPGKHVTTCPPG
jgi:hypothetical protein